MNESEKQLILIGNKLNLTLEEILENFHQVDYSDYDDFLDELYPDCEIAGYKYCTSNALREVDPIAYRCGFSDYTNGDEFIELDGDYYFFDEVEKYIEENLIEENEQ